MTLWTAIPQNCHLDRCWWGDLELRCERRTTALPENGVGPNDVSL